jgi:uncharacterized membrane protein YphA (DoxX/SURF4 family)
MSILKSFRESLSFDYRSLALYRVLIGLIVMTDVIYRLPDLVNFYTDIGLVPRSLFLTEMSMPWSFSFHLANGSIGFISLMFLIHFLAGLMLSIGYKTRLASIVCWIMTISVHNRNWLVNNGGDDILRSLLFITMFLPLQSFSFDSYGNNEEKSREKDSYFSSWGITFFVQVFAIYFVSYILKNHPIWREDYTAIFFASRLDIFATPIGVFFRQFPTFQKGLTIFTIYLEWLGPILLMISGVFGKHWWRVRFLIVILFWLLHLGIILTMWIGVFPYLCLAFWCLFIPGEVWERYLGHLLNKKWIETLKKKIQSWNFFLTLTHKTSTPSQSCKKTFWISEVFGGFILVTLLMWNLTTIKKWDIQAPVFQYVTRWLHIYQEWNMFAPYPKVENIWIEIPAILDDGSRIELLSGSRDIYSLKNDVFSQNIKNEHWRKFYLNVSEKIDNARYYGGYLCREWNQRNIRLVPDQTLRKMEIIIYSQVNLPDGLKAGVEKKMSWNHWCFEQDLKKDNPTSTP